MTRTSPRTPPPESSSSDEGEVYPTMRDLREMEEQKLVESLVEVDTVAVARRSFDCSVDQHFRQSAMNKLERSYSRSRNSIQGDG